MKLAPPKTYEKIASSILKDKTSDLNYSKLNLAQCSGGRKLNVRIGQDSPPVRKALSFSDMKDIKADLGLSTNKILKHAKHMRYLTSNRKCVEPNLKQHLLETSHKCDDYFAVHDMNLSKPDGFETEIKTPVVYCTDMDSLVQTLLKERMKDFEKVHFKIGIDGGGGFLKVCLNILADESQDISPLKRRKYDDVTREVFKDSSVQKLIILAIAPNVIENYANVFDIWSMLKMEDSLAYEALKTRFASDLKMCNLLLGLMSHASSHPCSWCNIHRYV